MYSDQDVIGVLGFIKSTPESSLRKMLVNGELTEVHFRLLMKMAKQGAESEFVSVFQAETLPKMRLSPAEIKIKENFWPICKSKLAGTGLLNLNAPKAA
jgi:hypothetical protein